MITTNIIILSAGVGPFESKAAMPRVAEEEEQMLGGQQQPTACMARQQPPSLPCPPPGLGLEQLKRRHIVASLVHSENNYVTSLQRLVNVSCALYQICHFSIDIKIRSGSFRFQTINTFNNIFRITKNRWKKAIHPF